MTAANMPESPLNLPADAVLKDSNLDEVIAADQVTVYLSALSEISPENAEHPRVQRICDALLRAMEAHRGLPENLDELETAGAVELAISIMLCHPKSEQVLLADFFVLRTLIQNRCATQLRVGQLRGIQLIVRSMLFLRQSSKIQLFGTALLLELTPTRDNREIMGEFFGIEVVSSAIQTFGKDTEIAATGCAFLANVGFQCDRNKLAIVRLGGVKLLLRSLRDHGNVECVTTWAALALRNLSFNNTANQESIARLGGLRLLLRAVVGFRGTEKVQTHAMGAILNIIQDNRNNTELLFKYRGIELVLSNMKLYRDSLDIQISCCAILKEISLLADSCASELLESGGLEAVLSAMIKQKSCMEIQESGFAIARRLAQLGPEACAQIVSAGGQETLTSALNAHISHEALVEEGLETIRFIRSSKASLQTTETALLFDEHRPCELRTVDTIPDVGST